MSNKTIYELDAASTISDTDLIPIWQTTNATGPTKKVLVSELRAAVSNTIPWANLTGDPMSNTEYKADYDALQAQITALTAQVAMASKILQYGTGGGVPTVAITFPPGYNSTTCMLFIAGRSAVAGGTGNGIRTINMVPTVTATGWNVAVSCMSEGGQYTYPTFSYFIISTTVAPISYDTGGGGGVAPPGGGQPPVDGNQPV